MCSILAPPVGFEPTHTAPEAATGNQRTWPLTWPALVWPVGTTWAVPRIFRIMVSDGDRCVRLDQKGPVPRGSVSN
jgi:hypothetical protein